tara:strand:+ start:2007 stop:2981 length:975 start_codon:yes stop_codon:yes gene_type:complete
VSYLNPLTGRFEGRFMQEAPMQEAPPLMMAPVTPQEPVAQVEPLPEPAVIEPPVPPPVQYSDDFGGRGQEQLGLPAIKGIKDILSGIPDIKPLTPEEQIAQYGETQYGMTGPLPKGYYAGPADGVYRYGEGPFAEETQKYLDSIGMTADEFAGPKPSSDFPPFTDLLGGLPPIGGSSVPYELPASDLPYQAPPDSPVYDGPSLTPFMGDIEPATPVNPALGGSHALPNFPFGGMGGIFGKGRLFGGGSPVGGLNSGIGSFLRPIINEVKRNKDQKLQEKISPYIDEVTQLTQNTFPEVNFSGQGQNVFTDYPAFLNQKDFGNFR